jgi:tetrahydrodipicolinate N-succinyltransferase
MMKRFPILCVLQQKNKTKNKKHNQFQSRRLKLSSKTKINKLTMSTSDNNKAISKKIWTESEDDELRQLVETYGATGNW